MTCEDCRLGVEADQRQSRTVCDPCTTLRTNGVRVSPMESDDLELVLAWRSNPEIYRHFRNQEGPLEWDDHVAWFDSRPSDRYDFVITYGDRRVGVVALSEDTEVTIYLGDYGARGEGVATAGLRWLCERFGDHTSLVAEINEDNDASRRLFTRCGFEYTTSEGPWRQYQYD